MTHRLARIGAATACWGLAVLLAGAACGAAGARVNVSRSIPLGLYWTSDAPVVRGATVLLCPPHSPVFDEARRRGYIGAGFCAGSYGFLMKRVVAIGGDDVQIAGEGVRVNGTLLPLSVPLVTDGRGRRLPRPSPARFRLRQSDVLLMSHLSALSFDGRYVGALPVGQIQTVLVPVVTW